MADIRDYSFKLDLPNLPGPDQNQNILDLFNALHGLAVYLSGTSGFVAPTGTASTATFDTTTVTLPDLAERVKALIDNGLEKGTL